MILMSWFTRGYWRETWATLAIAVWWTLFCYGLLLGLCWLTGLLGWSQWGTRMSA